MTDGSDFNDVVAAARVNPLSSGVYCMSVTIKIETKAYR